MVLEKLTQVSPPPQIPIEVGSPKMWEKIEARLGVTLPEDYKGFINRYGSGKFDNGILLFNPLAEIEELNLFQALDLHHRCSRSTQKLSRTPWSVVCPFELYPADEGLLPWGTMENIKETFFWKVNGHPDDWHTIFYNLKTGEYEVWKMRFTEILVKLFEGELKPIITKTDLRHKHKPIQFLSSGNTPE